MENLGQYLQQQREKQHISIEELASRTRIPLRFVEAIEENQFDQLPNQVSTKGFLRSYAECVGVDYSVISEAFSGYKTQNKYAFHPESQDKILSYLHVRKPIRVPFPRRIVLSVGGGILLLLVLVVVLSNRGKGIKIVPTLPTRAMKTLKRTVIPTVPREPILPEQMPVNTKDPIFEPEIASNQDTSDVSKKVTNEDPLDITTPVNIPTETSLDEVADIAEETSEIPSDGHLDVALESGVDSKQHVLFLEAIEPSWVQVTIDEHEVREALLQPSDTIIWKAEEKFLLTLGNAGGVRVQLDGQDLGTFGPTGEVVHREILGKSTPAN